MSDDDQQPPNEYNENKQEAHELSIEIDDLTDELEDYLARAEEVDDKYRRENENRRFHLDDLPYGEEIKRIESLLPRLAQSSKWLDKVIEGTMSVSEQNTILASARDVIDEARESKGEFTRLPSDR